MVPWVRADRRGKTEVYSPNSICFARWDSVLCWTELEFLKDHERIHQREKEEEGDRQ